MTELEEDVKDIDVDASDLPELKQNFDDMNSPTVGVEFVGTSISLGGNGSQKLDYTDVMIAENPL